MRGYAESSRTSPPRTWVADPPPWGTAQERFKPEGQPSGPEYHVAYRDVTQPPRWSTKGWTAMDDYTKPRRGTAPSTMGTSSLVPPTAPPRPAPGLAPLAPPCANEVRLQELLTLQRRKLHTEPGPGAYNARAPAGRRRFRRHHDPNVDGPFFLDQMPDGTSTRVKEISSLIRAPGDSGLGPGEYDGLLNKDAVMRSAPAVKVGTSDREGRTAHVKSLSVSRSIQNGIDWHVPVVVVTAVPKAPAATNGANGPAGGTSPRPASPGDQYRDRAGGSAGTDGGRRSPAARQGDAGMGGEGQRESRSRSPSPGAAEAVEKYLGAPPAPPAPVSRAVRRQQERKPGDWDWNRLGHNYRTNWTTMHGGAYTQGEHPQPPRGPQGSLSSPMALSHANLHHQQQQQQQQQQALLHAGIYPIQEESSGALAQDTSTYSMQQQQQQQQQLESMQYQQQQQPQPGLLPSVVHNNPHMHTGQQPQQQSSWDGAGPGVGPGGFGGPGGAGGGAGRGRGLKGMIRDEDLRRRQEAAALAAQALAANTRVSDWQSKFAG